MTIAVHGSSKVGIEPPIRVNALSAATATRTTQAYVSRISLGHQFVDIPRQALKYQLLTGWRRGWDSNHCWMLITKNLACFSFRTIR
jgi:hypothetical protein